MMPGCQPAKYCWIRPNSWNVLDWIVQCFTSPPTQYRLYGRRFLQVKRPNQQYQSTEGDATKENKTKKHKENRKYTHKKKDTNNRYTNKHSKSPRLQ